MNGGPAAWLKKLFGGKSAGGDAVGGLAPIDGMAAQATLCLGLVYGRGADENNADNGLALAMEYLRKENIKATFICAAKLAETAPVALSRIRDHGHEIACHGYHQEQPQKVDDQMLSRLLLKAREVMGKRGIHPAGYIPPSGNCDLRICREVAKQGFKYVSDLRSNAKPSLAVAAPVPLCHLPITSNDSGYVRHPDQPNHVYDKHIALVKRAAGNNYFLGLSYHTWMFGERRERFEDFVAILSAAVDRGMKVVPFVESLPEKYRPPVKVRETNEWGF